MKTNPSCIKIKSFQIIVCLVLLSLLAGTQPVQAFRETSASPRPNRDSAGLQPLEALLNADGTLNLSSGFSGSLDATGWQLSTGPGGEPRFTRAGAPIQEGNAPTAAGDEFWDDQFILGVYYSPQPTNSSVFAIAVSGTNVYVGGDFDRAGNVAANRIAKWDSHTHKWSALGSGVNSRVLAIAASGDDVYAGGNFTRAGDIHTGPVAHWNDATHKWSAMGDELTNTSTSPEVDAIAIAGNGDVYVGGNFEKAGSLTLNNIARWDGSSWHALSSGIGGSFHDVLAIAISGSDVYIGGHFDTAGGSIRNNIARWNGSTWFNLGAGTGGIYPGVCAIAINGTNIYIGGEFVEVTDSINGTQTVGHVAMWNGSVWSTLGGGLGDPDVYALALGSDGNIYAGGRFHTLADGSTSANRLARWNDSAWHSVDGSGFTGSDGVKSNVYALAFMDDQMYLGGFFTGSNSGRTLNYIGYYDIIDNEWYALGNSVNGPVYALAMNGDYIYIGGTFTSAGGVKASGIARWNQRTGDWYSLRGGMSGCTPFTLGGCRTSVYAIVVDGSDVFVGGNFTSAGGVSANGIARWDTITQYWYPLLTGGDTSKNGVTCDGLGCSAYVRSIQPSSYYGILVAGKFDYAGGTGNQANNVADWIGDHWYALGNGTNNVVYAIATEAFDSSVLYIGGTFTSPSSFIAKWDGATWSSLNADPVNGAVYAIKKVGYLLYVGGAFTTLGGPNGNYITTFTSDWVQLDGDPLNDIVYAINDIPGFVFAGGNFTASGALGINRIGYYYGSSWSGYGSGADDIVYAVAPYLIRP
jgi:hypothetical protein